jgi:hypothetical protein
MSTQDSSQDEALRNEIQAAIAAGRELGPDMDRHLAESVLERYRKEQVARQQALVPKPATKLPARPANPSETSRIVMAVAAIAAFVAIIVLKPDFWWVIFFLPAIAGAWGWDRWKHN